MGINYASFLYEQTLKLMKTMDELHKLASETKLREDWVKYKSTRNKVNNRLTYEESVGQKSRLEACSDNSTKTWKSIKGILNWHSSGSPTKLFYKGSLRTKAQDLADSQNEFFIEKIENIRANMPHSSSDPLLKLRSLMVDRKCSFSLSTVHPDQVDTIISNRRTPLLLGLIRLTP